MTITVEEALFGHMTADAGVSALISTRFYADAAPQNPTYPLAIYHQVSGTRTQSLLGASGLADPRFQISGLDRTAAGAAALREALRKAVSGYQGLMSSLPVYASAAFGDAKLYYDDIRIFQRSFDVVLTHQENL